MFRKSKKSVACYTCVSGYTCVLITRKEAACFSIYDPTKWLLRFSSANDIKYDNHDGDHQKEVNETAQRVGSDQTQDPQYYQNNSDSIKHINYPFFFWLSVQQLFSREMLLVDLFVFNR